MVVHHSLHTLIPLCLCVRVCVGSVLQINRGSAAGVSKFPGFQRGLPDPERGHAGEVQSSVSSVCVKA